MIKDDEMLMERALDALEGILLWYSEAKEGRGYGAENIRRVVKDLKERLN